MHTVQEVSQKSPGVWTFLLRLGLSLLIFGVVVALASSFSLSAGQAGLGEAATQLYALNLNNLGASSYLVVNNPNQTQAQVLLQFFQEDGSPITPNNVPGGNPFALGPGQSQEIELAAIGDLPNVSMLSASIASDQPVVALNRYRYFFPDFNLEFHAISQVHSSQEATTSLYVSDVRAVSSESRRSTLVVFNPGDVGGNVTIALVDSSGYVPYTAEATLNPKGSYSLQVANVVPNGFRGAAIVTATTPVLAAHSLEGAAVVRQNGVNQGATTHYAPYLYDMPQTENHSELVIQSLSQTPANVAITNSDGQGNAQIQIPPGGLHIVDYDNASHSDTFATKIESDQPLTTLVVHQVGAQSQRGPLISYEPLPASGTDFMLPLQYKQYQEASTGLTWNSFVDVYNPGSETAQVQMWGTNVNIDTQAIDPGRQRTFALSDFSSVPTGYMGPIYLRSTLPVAVVGRIRAMGTISAADMDAAYAAFPIAPPSTGGTPTVTPTATVTSSPAPPTNTPTATTTPTAPPSATVTPTATATDTQPPPEDGNGDGIPDAQQPNVETIASTTGNYITLAGPSGITLENVKSSAPVEEPPVNVTLPQGLLGFEVNGLSAGSTFSVTLTIHSGPMATSYWKYGPTADNSSDHWYDFTYDGETGAVIAGNQVTLYFVDGKRGDSDLAANGSIVDPGGPATTQYRIYLPGIDKRPATSTTSNATLARPVSGRDLGLLGGLLAAGIALGMVVLFSREETA